MTWTFTHTIAFLTFCFVQGITPGPANVLSLATSLTKGRKVALRQWRGLFTGFFIVAMVSALLAYFVGTRLNAYIRYFTWIGAIYVIWLAIRMLRSALRAQEGVQTVDPGKENNFFTGLFTNLTNVKVMIMCITAMTGYVLPYTNSFPILLLFGCFMPFTGPICNLVWIFVGSNLQILFKNHNKLINIVMAIALIACAVNMVSH